MCYGDNIGEVARSIDHPQTGTNGLRVWANKNGTVKSNHVIGSHIVYPTQGITGRLRYGTWAYAASAIGFTQSGPEISVQNTRPVDGVNMTYIAGVQYIGNQWVTNKVVVVWAFIFKKDRPIKRVNKTAFCIMLNFFWVQK